MLIFKSSSDLKQLATDDLAYPVVKSCIEHLIDAYTSTTHPYLVAEHGYIVLVEEVDLHQRLQLPELHCHLFEVRWEGVVKRDGYYNAICLTNNEFGISFLIPDKAWVGCELRALLESNLSS